MKYILIVAALITCFSVSSCSKKGNAAPTPHTITITANGSAEFAIALSVIRNDVTTSAPLENKTVTGSYSYTTQLNTGDLVQLSIQTSAANVVSYTITDNGATGLQVTDKELGSFSRVTGEYTVK